MILYFFFFNDTATTEIYTLSLHDALPIYPHFAEVCESCNIKFIGPPSRAMQAMGDKNAARACRSEEHTSELQSQSNLVCRLLLEKKTARLSGPPRSPATAP